MKRSQEQDYLKILKDIRESKDMDEIADLFMTMISICGLKMDEVAALNYYITERTLKADHNARFLRERMEIDINDLSIDGILQIQRSLVNVYVGKLKK
ncbi:MULTISPECIES: hypothetical protein [Enterococcus]|uniref:Uncharacterized protein n=2 Tax=Enterococcus gallinarum TaxID=1353 RepID=A0AAE7MP06_ENTGA|nr:MULTISPECIES: hypothetical protein [Enterococcus]MBM6742015.1 hypothetical protein [Enterococcus gallinarum]MCO5531667.1 hypothetical protein [Enterococcus faecium]MDT2714340.1 hypothetical protein [Enterococcus gallinarum]NQE03914.1 hypothetical protein [Enterococcus gallinarum]QOG26993.1 hypothetical protein EGM181_06915 [Enterococcus gallinarum]